LLSALEVGLALIVLLATVTTHWLVWRGRAKLGYLKEVAVEPLGAKTAPMVSIIVSALNEEHTIEPALRSLLALQYAAFEVIAINDRSTDNTGAVLDQLQQENPQLKVVHITDLPQGWLGKCHALHQGSQVAQGDYFLFTDADVHFEPSTLQKAMQYCSKHSVDHLTLVFGIIANGSLLRLILVSLGIGLFARFQPWKAGDPYSPKFFGVGGFNLVKRQAYVACGGHERLKLAILDDITLGQHIKQGGFTQAVLNGDELVQLEWYPTTKALFKGLEKNTFAALQFQKRQLLGISLAVALVHVWPWVAVVVTTGWVQGIYAACLLVLVAGYAESLRSFGWRLTSLLWLPLLGLFELALLWNSSVKVLSQKGVVWRGTLYSLSVLRKK
jgi:GT2 family glycosyltransferase